MTLSNLDIAIVIVYAVSIFALAQWVSREKESHRKDAQDYFLASRALPWWAIGTSLIAANISAEQIIGMSGSGYVIGLGIASYEWMAAITLLVVGKYFVPIFLKNGIYTMPEFLERRYSPAVRTTMAVFWLGRLHFRESHIDPVARRHRGTHRDWHGRAGCAHRARCLRRRLRPLRRTQGRGAHRRRAGYIAGFRRAADQLPGARSNIRRRRRDSRIHAIDDGVAAQVRHDPVRGQSRATRTCLACRCCSAGSG